jgi:hypothetical protein
MFFGADDSVPFWRPGMSNSRIHAIRTLNGFVSGDAISIVQRLVNEQFEVSAYSSMAPVSCPNPGCMAYRLFPTHAACLQEYYVCHPYMYSYNLDEQGLVRKGITEDRMVRCFAAWVMLSCASVQCVQCVLCHDCAVYTHMPVLYGLVCTCRQSCCLRPFSC